VDMVTSIFCWGGGREGTMPSYLPLCGPTARAVPLRGARALDTSYGEL
jgi:hypothetical protein